MALKLVKGPVIRSLGATSRGTPVALSADGFSAFLWVGCDRIEDDRVSEAARDEALLGVAEDVESHLLAEREEDLRAAAEDVGRVARAAWEKGYREDPLAEAFGRAFGARRRARP